MTAAEVLRARAGLNNSGESKVMSYAKAEIIRPIQNQYNVSYNKWVQRELPQCNPPSARQCKWTSPS